MQLRLRQAGPERRPASSRDEYPWEHAADVLDVDCAGSTVWGGGSGSEGVVGVAGSSGEICEGASMVWELCVWGMYLVLHAAPGGRRAGY